MTILKALIFLGLLTGAGASLAESPSEAEQLAARFSDYLHENNIVVDRSSTRTDRAVNGTSTIRIAAPGFLLFTIGVYARDEDAEREYTSMSIQNAPLGKDAVVTGQNANLIFFALPLTDQQAEKARTIRDIFMNFAARSQVGIKKEVRQAVQP